MRIDNLTELPEWDDDEFLTEGDESEEWKPNPTRTLCKAMYQQWNNVMLVLKATLDNLTEPAEEDLFSREHIEDHKAMMLGDAFEVGDKIISSETGLYVIRMENAAIIRKHAQFIKNATNSFIADYLMEEEHRQMIRSEINKFRELFKQWVATFEKDDCEDEWGLFI